MGIFTEIVDNTHADITSEHGSDKYDHGFKHMSKTQTKFGTTLGDYWNNVKTRSAVTKYR